MKIGLMQTPRAEHVARVAKRRRLAASSGAEPVVDVDVCGVGHGERDSVAARALKLGRVQAGPQGSAAAEVRVGAVATSTTAPAAGRRAA